MENSIKKSENAVYCTINNTKKKEFCWNSLIITIISLGFLLLFCFYNNKKPNTTKTDSKRPKQESNLEASPILPPFAILDHEITKKDIELFSKNTETGLHQSLAHEPLYPNFFSINEDLMDKSEKIFFSHTPTGFNVNIITNEFGIYRTESFVINGGNEVVSVFFTKQKFKCSESSEPTVVIITKDKNRFQTSFLQGYGCGNGRYICYELYDEYNSTCTNKYQGVKSEKEFIEKVNL